MKQLPLLLTLCLLVIKVSAQDGVGIGNSNPQELLDVSGAIKIGGSTIGALDAGTIRWNGSRFQGYNGSTWLNLDETAFANPTASTGTAYSPSTINPSSSAPGTEIIAFTLPSAGTYLIQSEVRLSLSSGSHARLALYQFSSSTPIPSTQFESICNGGSVTRTCTSQSIITVTSGGSILLRCRRMAGTVQVRSDSNGRSKMTYIKLD